MTEEEKTIENQEEKVKEKPRKSFDDNVIFIGGKPFMNYVTGVVMQFTTQKANEIVIKARGKFISRAVDVAEVTTRRFLENTSKITDIKINSEEFRNKEGKDIRVSTIEITVAKK